MVNRVSPLVARANRFHRRTRLHLSLTFAAWQSLRAALAAGRDLHRAASVFLILGARFFQHAEKAAVPALGKGRDLAANPHLCGLVLPFYFSPAHSFSPVHGAMETTLALSFG